MKKLIYFSFFLFPLFSIWAQTPIAAQEINKNKFMDGSAQIGRGTQLGTFDNRYEGIRGSSLLFSSWMNGSVLLHNRQLFDSLLLNYDAYTNEVVLKQGNNLQVFMTTQVVSFIVDIPQTSTYKKYDIPEAKTKHGSSQFYEVLYEGTYTLLRQPLKMILEADSESAFNSGRHYDEFIDKSFFYLSDKEGNFHKIKLSKKALQKALPIQSKHIHTLTKQLKIDLSEVEDIVKLLKTLEELN